MITIVITSILLSAIDSTTAVMFSYDRQDLWDGVCVSGNSNKQSPINIETSHVTIDYSLNSLMMSNQWWFGQTGRFENCYGQTVKFFPNSNAIAITTPFGAYELQEFHMHWAKYDGDGTDHRINGCQNEVEIHFVHIKQRATNVGQVGYYAVVAVMAEVNDDESFLGPWKLLDPAAVQKYKSEKAITGLILNQLLPVFKNYYFYKGSLTTPPCSETVHWYVMKQRIRVPRQFVDRLRQVEKNSDGAVIGFNNRDLQNLGGRPIYTPF